MCLRSSPLYNTGALAFNVGDETPRVGELLISLWNFAVNKLRFKLVSSADDESKAGLSASAAQDGTSPAVGTSKSLGSQIYLINPYEILISYVYILANEILA